MSLPFSMTKNKNPTLSIITVTYNSGKNIKPYLDSLKKYLFPHVNSELIIVDNNSKDNTVSLLEKLSFSTPQLTLFRNPKNLGFAAANNQAVKIAKGKFLFFLNPDTCLKDSSIKKLIQKLENNPKIGIISPALVNERGDYQPLAYPPQTLKNAFQEFFLQKKTFSPYIPKEEQEVHSLVAAAILIKKSLFDRLGGWDEKYFMYFEDHDLCDRVRKAGKKVLYSPQSKIIHEVGSSCKTIKKKPNQWLIQSSKKYHGILKYYLLTLILWSGQKWQKLKK